MCWNLHSLWQFILIIWRDGKNMGVVVREADLILGVCFLVTRARVAVIELFET